MVEKIKRRLAAVIKRTTMPASDLPNPSSLVPLIGREEELETLSGLAEGRDRVAAVIGHTGTGKTTLALMFAERFRSSFSGGVIGTCAAQFSSVASRFQSQEHLNPTLVVIDEAHNMLASVEEELSGVFKAIPAARILLLSQLPLQSSRIDKVITLEKWPLEATELLLGKFSLLDSYDRRTVESIHSRLAGNPRSIQTWIDALRSHLFSPNDWQDILLPIRKSGLVDKFGNPIASTSAPYKAIVSDIQAVNEELLRRLLSNPKLLYSLTPRGFEEVVAELLARLGYEVTLTPVSRDGGKDIYAAERGSLGSFLYIIECKRFAPDRPVGVSLVRELFGVVQAERATAGILATTSSFTRDAQEFQAQVPFNISLQDYFGIQEWLRSALLKPANPRLHRVAGSAVHRRSESRWPVKSNA
jgi:restriction system protein